MGNGIERRGMGVQGWGRGGGGQKGGRDAA